VAFFLTRVCVVSVSNFCWDIDCCAWGLLWLLSLHPVGPYLKLGHDRFLPHPFHSFFTLGWTLDRVNGNFVK
jgi:hypothetical protein